MTLRALTSILSLALHGAFVALFFVTPGGAALDSGSGDDMFIVEQGIAIEGFAQLGDAEVTTEEVEAPTEISEARPPLEEVKPVEEDVQHVIGSESGPEQKKIVKEPEPEKVEEPHPQQVATLEQTEVAVEEQKASGAKKTGGDTTAASEYRGKLYQHLEKKKVNPRSREAGTVVVRFTVDSSGQVVSREVTESSGSKMLDDAAVASIDKAAPFPPMPGDIASAPMVVSVPFKFSVR
jgi:protein TonB